MTAYRFCTACQATREVEGGMIKQTRSAPRWICRGCLERKHESIYKNRSGRPADVARLMAELTKGAA